MDESKIMCQSIEKILEAHHAPRGKERRKGSKEIWEVLGERENWMEKVGTKIRDCRFKIWERQKAEARGQGLEIFRLE